MFTSQSGQIENALRLGGMGDISAKEMVQSLANCQAPIQHRGQLTISRPNQNYFPTLAPAGPSLAFPQMDARNITINIPPWQSIPFTPIPYPEWPEWKDTPYLDPPVVVIDGPVQAGPLQTPETTTVEHNSTTINNEGDVYNGDAIYQDGDVFIGGNVFVDRRVTHRNQVINQGPVINNNQVINRHEVHNEVAHNYFTHNHGPTYHYDETYYDGPTYYEGPVQITGPIIVNGIEMQSLSLTLVTAVEWDGTDLTIKTREATVFGVAEAEQTTTLLSGTSCPE
jgi:hypothetical protein